MSSAERTHCSSSPSEPHLYVFHYLLQIHHLKILNNAALSKQSEHHTAQVFYICVSTIKLGSGIKSNTLQNLAKQLKRQLKISPGRKELKLQYVSGMVFLNSSLCPLQPPNLLREQPTFQPPASGGQLCSHRGDRKSPSCSSYHSAQMPASPQHVRCPTR